MLTDEECNKFRRHPGSFNEMVNAIYEAGRLKEREDKTIITVEDHFVGHALSGLLASHSQDADCVKDAFEIARLCMEMRGKK